MKVFISWSGQPSQAVAELLKDWIKCVIQSSDPFISTHDIERGAVWFNEISSQLQDAAIGIICLTKENREKPWILFEAGALTKELTTSRVCPLLIDLQPSDIEGPLSQFNHTIPTKAGMKSLVTTLNKHLGDAKLDSSTLDKVFEVYWPLFEKGFSDAIDNYPPVDQASEPRSSDSMLREVLTLTRSLSQRVGRLENRSVSAQRFVSLSDSYEGEVDYSFLVEQAIAERLDRPLTVDLLVAKGMTAFDAEKAIDLHLKNSKKGSRSSDSSAP